jgi:hypothetical protein
VDFLQQKLLYIIVSQGVGVYSIFAPGLAFSKAAIASANTAPSSSVWGPFQILMTTSSAGAVVSASLAEVASSDTLAAAAVAAAVVSAVVALQPTLRKIRESISNIITGKLHVLIIFCIFSPLLKIFQFLFLLINFTGDLFEEHMA